MYSLPAKSISHHIRLPRMILQSKLVVFQELHPSTLSHVQILLIEQVLQTFVISEDCERTPIQIVPPNLEWDSASHESSTVAKHKLSLFSLASSHNPDHCVKHHSTPRKALLP